MSSGARRSLAAILGATFLLSSCGYVRAFADQALDQGQAQDAARLLEVARAYAEGTHLADAPPLQSPAAQSPSPNGTSSDNEEYEYQDQMMMYLVRQDYDHLDQEARDARLHKTRFKGGTWKLFDFYEGLSKPPLGDQATDQDWELQIDALKAWVAARPESAAARITLAEAYNNFGFHARGSGYANTVSDDGWNLLSERAGSAASVLEDAAKLKEKDPYWYSAMQRVALIQGWDKSQARELLDAAIAFEPTYYHAYRLYANFMLPKWYGDPGEVEAFAGQVSDQIGGQQGKFVYFELATVIVCGCNSDDDGTRLRNLSWPKIKDGYAALGGLYGYSNLKMNRFAYLAAKEHDRRAARPVFVALGDNWDHEVWRSQLDFLNARAWAESQQGQ